MNLKELKEIFRLVEKTDFSEVEIVQSDFRVRIGRGDRGFQPKVESAPAHRVLQEERVVEAPSKPVVQAQTEEKGVFVTSPFVGTFYRAPAPDSDPYVQVGQSVKKGQILCIVEAMKLMNEIEAEADGKIAEIYPESGQAVEFGEKLFRIET